MLNRACAEQEQHNKTHTTKPWIADVCLLISHQTRSSLHIELVFVVVLLLSIESNRLLRCVGHTQPRMTGVSDIEGLSATGVSLNGHPEWFEPTNEADGQPAVLRVHNSLTRTIQEFKPRLKR